jgi:hypothetical protein
LVIEILLVRRGSHRFFLKPQGVKRLNRQVPTQPLERAPTFALTFWK